MIRKILVAFAFLLTGTMVFQLFTHQVSTSASGSPGGYTGSPGDNFRTCRSCHGSGSAPFQSGLISSNIPSTGYVPGTTYSITASIAVAGKTKFGFEVVSENAARQTKGTFSHPTSETRSVAGGVTQTTAGTGGSGSRTWTVNWVAPAAGTGQITFYGAFNASNANGSADGGDQIFTSSLTVNENIGSGISSSTPELEISIFPNPASNVLTVTLEDAAEAEYFIADLHGKILLKGRVSKYLDISHLPGGKYFLHVQSQDEAAVKAFVKL